MGYYMSELGVNSMPLGHKEGEYATTVFMSDPDGDRVYTGTWHTATSAVGGIYN